MGARALLVVIVAACGGGGSSDQDRTFTAGKPASGAANSRPSSVPGSAEIVGACAIPANPGGGCPPGTACNGTFASAVPYAAGTSPGPLAIADLGNGHLDVVVGNSAGKISVLLGTGTGVLGAPASITLAGTIFDVVIADFNGDTKPDIAVATGTDVRVLLGNGNGTFAAVAKITAVASNGIAAAHMDGNATMDLVSYSGANIVVLLGVGDGTFTAGTAVVATSAGQIAAADIDGDGKQDVAVGVGNGVSVLLGDGLGGLGAAQHYAVGTGPFAIGDVDRNGKPDLAQSMYLPMGNSFITATEVAKNMGNGTFGAPTPFLVETDPNNGSRLTIGDADGDGLLDLIVAGPSNVPLLTVLAGRGDGTFQQSTPNFAGAGTVTRVSVVDLNADGRPDLVACNPGNNSVVVLLGQPPTGCSASSVTPACPAGTNDCSLTNICANTSALGSNCCTECSAQTGCTLPTCPTGYTLDPQTNQRETCCPDAFTPIACDAFDFAPYNGCGYAGALPSPVGPQGPCTDGKWCGSGSRCAGATCCPDDHPVGCGSSCCLAGSTCSNGACGCPAGALACGDACCDAGAQCVNDQCVSTCTDSKFPTPCGDLCLADGVPCSNGTYTCPAAYDVTCGGIGECCLAGTSCIGATCGCPSGEAVCGAKCCGTGEVCDAGTCKKPAGGGSGHPDGGGVPPGCPASCAPEDTACGYCLAGQINCPAASGAGGLCCSGETKCGAGTCYVDPTCTHSGCPANAGGIPGACGGDFSKACGAGCCHMCLACDQASGLCYNP